MSRYMRYLLFIFILISCTTVPTSMEEKAMIKPISTFDAALERDTQSALEADFDAVLNPKNLDEWMQHMSSKPHHVGSPWSKQNAEFIAGKFRAWGFETEIETFDVLLPTPKILILEMVAPTTFKAQLKEPALEGDATSGILKDRLPGYNAFSADGDVTAELVYVNYGIPADYEELERRGIDVKGKIVIARYGASWRGIKVKLAYEHGAVGCIIYSDPKDDGYFRGDVYPEGPYRMARGIQRGSVLDMPLYPGDPLTPGYGATKDAERLDYREAPTIMKIPVIPISYADAQPLLEALTGPVVPPEWRGALPITYHIGPGPARVHLKLEFDWKLRTAYNPVGRIKGSKYPDEWIMRGNHHDGWVFGAADPLSGMVATMEEARAIGELVKKGWRPKRTLIYAGWDAEEPALLGSTEWVEFHQDELSEHLVIYINTDGTGRGFLRVGGSHTLEKFVNEVMVDVDDPQLGVSTAERVRARLKVNGKEEGDREDLPIYAMGSGSDYTAFIHHLGITSMNLGFGGESGGGSYHSAFDSYDHYIRFMDPGFQYGITLSKVTGRLVMRLSEAEILPFRFVNFADHVGRYIKELKELAEKKQKATEKQNTLLDENAYILAADPTKTYVPPVKEDPVPDFDFTPLEAAHDKLEKSALAYEKILSKYSGSIGTEQRQQLNGILMKVERAMIRKDGLPRRPWFRHQIYAPGYYTGYGVKTLPGIREGLEERNWDEVREYILIVSKTLKQVAVEIDRAAAILAS